MRAVLAWDERRGPDPSPLGAGPLREASPDVRVGTAVDDAALVREPGYREVLAREFAAVTPENAMKWSVLAPSPTRTDWGAADRLVDFAEEHDLAVRGHTLVWYAQNPPWVEEGSWTRKSLGAVVREHIREVMGRYRGRVGTWDVVNEPIAEGGGGLRDSVFSRVMGTGYVAAALRWAREADPDAKLYVNEIGAEAPGPKADAYYGLVRELVVRGVPLDGVGFQVHLALASGLPDGFADNARRFEALGLDVALTEVDVAVPDDAGPDALRRQGEIYREVGRACRALERCRSLTVWGFTDRHSWIPASSPGTGRATVLDAEYALKPAYTGLLEGLRG